MLRLSTSRRARTSTPSRPRGSGSTTSTLRTSLASLLGRRCSSGRFGIHNGVVGHGGTAAVSVSGRQSTGASAAGCRRDVGEPDAGRRALDDVHQHVSGTTLGLPLSCRVSTSGTTSGRVASRRPTRCRRRHPVAAAATATRSDWFLHVHMWDPHTPYRRSGVLRRPIRRRALARAGSPRSVRARHWSLPGPHSAQEITGFGPTSMCGTHSRANLRSPATWTQVRRMFDGYDTGVRYADHHVGSDPPRLVAPAWASTKTSLSSCPPITERRSGSWGSTAIIRPPISTWRTFP